MCNDYARELEMGRIISYMKEIENLPPFEWEGGRIPNDAGPTPHIKIRESGVIVRFRGEKLIGSNTIWAWKTPQGKPVFNFVSEGRRFDNTERCLIPATGFYEYTQPKQAKVRLKDQHLFTMKDEAWFWIVGIVKSDCFAMLTTEPGPDMQPYHDRQVVVLKPNDGLDWLTLAKPEAELLRPPPAEGLAVRTLRRDGVDLN
jgi:putative SOS response-associated peptidase YedK